MDLTQVSRTAVLLLICRAVESARNKAEFDDPMAVVCLDRLMSAVSGEDKRWIARHKRLYEVIKAGDSKAGVKRGRVFDHAVNRFVEDNPGCTVINLACGFDTRYWRIKNEKCRFIEIDLPAVIDLKKEILKDDLKYELIGCSALDTTWIDNVTTHGNTGFLILAEGLFMWLPPQEAIRL
jgi:O-methyltransferase involved in polyketide biosynthesis